MSKVTYDLVQQMTMREKAHFKRFAQTYSSTPDKNYLKLYAYLQEQPAYDAAAMKQHFAAEPFGAYLSSELNYLLERLLDSLTHFHAEATPYRKLLRLIQYIELLNEREFRAKAQKMLARAKKLAYRYEEFTIILDLVRLEEEILFRHGVINFTQQLQQLKDERSQVMAQIQNLTELRLLREQVRDLQFTVRWVEEPQQYPHIYANPLLDDAAQALSLGAQENWHYIQGVRAYLVRQFDKGRAANRQYVLFIDEHSHLFKKSKWLPALSNYMFMSALAREADCFEDGLKRLLALRSDAELDQPYISYIYYSRLLEYHYQFGEVAQTAALVPEISAYFQQYAPQLGQAESDYLTRLLVRSCIITGQPSAALDWVHRWHEVKKSDHALDIVRLLTLVAYWEMDYLEVLEAEAISCRKNLKAIGQLSPLAKALTRFFRRYATAAPNAALRQQLRKDLHQQLQALASDPAENQLLLFFDFVGWAAQGGMAGRG